MKPYNPQEIEPRWQKKWEETELYKAVDFDKKPKFFTLVEFPYPSGAGLHIGHVRSWAAMDCYSRKKRMQGFNVLYPMGWDAFGLPAENYAIKMGKHPSKTVAENIQRFKIQCQNLGLSFDWSREINTTDPKYYRWTQWIFLKLLEHGLAFRKEVPVNWCPSCKTTLANEEVLADGTHERCGKLTEKRQQKQWLLRITKYAQRLLEDLNLVDYSQKIRIQQENWIGRSEGTEVKFGIADCQSQVDVFTTRIDTIFGVTALVLAPEHEIIAQLRNKVKNIKEVEDYQKKAKEKSELERTDLTKQKTGIKLEGVKAINPFNKEEIPVFIADYVLEGYGTGAVMAVPAHDSRDHEFAEKYSLPINEVIASGDIAEKVFTGEGKLVNSGQYSGLSSEEAIEKINAWLRKEGLGGVKVNYKMRDWIFSRQHYWGEPIPVIHCEKCGVVPVPEKDLPVELPYVEKYEPSGTGESPLSNIKDWVKTTCPKCNGKAERETDTMPNWAGSNWYFVRYLDPNNDQKIAAKDKMKYWLPIDIYQGGFEHTTLHLLYSRFIYKFLYDIDVVPTLEPYAKRRSHGIVLGPDNRKMSKSFGNVVNPDEIVLKYGADTLRLYEMFMGPFDQAVSWNEDSLQGCFRFLTRVWKLFNENIKEEKTPDNLLRKLHQTIKKVSQDFEDLKFNTMVAALMEFINDWEKSSLSKKEAELFIQSLAPLAPHISEEIWTTVLKNKLSVHLQAWPEFNEELIIEERMTIIIQVNGKIRGQIEMDNQDSQDETRVMDQAKKDLRIIKYLEAKEIKKVIFVPGKLINFVTT